MRAESNVYLNIFLFSVSRIIFRQFRSVGRYFQNNVIIDYFSILFTTKRTTTQPRLSNGAQVFSYYGRQTFYTRETPSLPGNGFLFHDPERPFPNDRRTFLARKPSTVDQRGKRRMFVSSFSTRYEI